MSAAKPTPRVVKLRPGRRRQDANALTGGSTGPGSPPRLRATDIRVNFGGIHALAGVSLEVRVGEILGVIGPNGAGKTTLLNCLSGLQRTHAGTVELLGEDVTRLPAHQIARRGVGRTFQIPNLIRHATVLENVLLGADSHARSTFIPTMFGLPGARRDERRRRDEAMSLLERLGAADLAHTRADHLAHAQKRTIEMARVLAIKPAVILLDEPTSGMSEATRDGIGDVMSAIREDGVAAQIVIEHDISFVRNLCDRLVVLNFGTVLASGEPEAVFNDPAVRESYLGGL